MSKVLSSAFRRIGAVLELAGMSLSRIIPRRKDMLVFGAWFGNRYDDNSRYLFEQAASRPGLRCIWISKDPAIVDRIRKSGRSAYRMGNLRALWYTLRARYIVYSVGTEDVGPLAAMGGATLVNLWHGVPIKKVGALTEHSDSSFWRWVNGCRKRLSRWYVFSTSESVSALYGKVFELEPSRIIDVGQARNDYFYSPHENPLRARFSGMRIVLYMPTFRQIGEQANKLESVFDLPSLDAFCSSHGIMFLVKQHYYVKPGDLSGYSNIIQIADGSCSVQEILDAADILITDYSSCFVDYLLLDRPQVFYAYDLEDYKSRCRDLIFDFETTVPGRVCRTMQELLEELERLGKGSDLFVAKRHDKLDFYHSPGNRCAVGEKQIQTILTL